MTKLSAWTYLDAMVNRRNSLTLSRNMEGTYFAVVNGHNFGRASTCRAAVVKAVRDFKRPKTNAR